MTDEDRTAQLTVAMADRVEEGLADHHRAEPGYTVHEQADPNMLCVVAQVGTFPEIILAKQKPRAELTTLLSGASGVPGTVLEDDLGLRQAPAQRSACTEGR